MIPPTPKKKKKIKTEQRDLSQYIAEHANLRQI